MQDQKRNERPRKMCGNMQYRQFAISDDSNILVLQYIQRILKQFSTITILQYHFKHPNHHLQKKAMFMSLKNT